jgi:hypothetical protein
VRQYITEPPEFADVELVIAHRLDLGVVAGDDEHLDLAAELVADQLAELVVNRGETRRGVVGLDPEADRAVVGAVAGVRRDRGKGAGKCQADAGDQGPKTASIHSQISR